jgi:hypothetical protein
MKSAQGMPNNLVMVRRVSLPLALRGPDFLLCQRELPLSCGGVMPGPGLAPHSALPGAVHAAAQRDDGSTDLT